MAEITATIDTDTVAKPQDALRLWPLFLVIGALIYGALYLWSEGLVYQHGDRNRFFRIATTPPTTFDTVILGASHAMPLGYADFNDRLQAAIGGSVMNLSIEGAGVLPNRLVLDYFFKRHAVTRIPAATTTLRQPGFPRLLDVAGSP